MSPASLRRVGGNGERVPDDTYRVSLVAKRKTATGPRVDHMGTTAEVDTLPADGVLQLSHDAIYPRTTEIRDSIAFQYPAEARVRVLIRDPRGVVVERMRLRSRPLINDSLLRTDWFARTDSGQPLPPGNYRARFVVRDAAGNSTILERKILVFAEQATRQVRTQTLTAAQTSTYRPPCFPQGCGEPGTIPCGTVTASDRFTSGRSFRSACESGPPIATSGFQGYVYVPFNPSPVDEYRVTATGGPTEVGSPDHGLLTTRHYYGGEFREAIAAGDSATTTEWMPADMDRFPGNRPTWEFSTRDGDSYDVATFTLEYAYYDAP